VGLAAISRGSAPPYSDPRLPGPTSARRRSCGRTCQRHWVPRKDHHHAPCSLITDRRSVSRPAGTTSSSPRPTATARSSSCSREAVTKSSGRWSKSTGRGAIHSKVARRQRRLHAWPFPGSSSSSPPGGRRQEFAGVDQERHRPGTRTANCGNQTPASAGRRQTGAGCFGGIAVDPPAPSRTMAARKRPTPSYGAGRMIGLELGRRLKA
jgi:hypothetical protein